ncbi:hypothetical protein [Flavobacterium phragmitis]|uniref:Uncharacterized protein n=1 Tax=Flavobacterium phragmitis TaxID=739143 RepID=A0A1I1S4Q2_9FLAO|nr:hypothetical protein [Flavobacterium phragmitis]SFD37950.1 hypothetical protein SAMN05216297_107165 [Flavobacterium phragmitis]
MLEEVFELLLYVAMTIYYIIHACHELNVMYVGLVIFYLRDVYRQVKKLIKGCQIENVDNNKRKKEEKEVNMEIETRITVTIEENTTVKEPNISVRHQL